LWWSIKDFDNFFFDGTPHTEEKLCLRGCKRMAPAALHASNRQPTTGTSQSVKQKQNKKQEKKQANALQEAGRSGLSFHIPFP